MASSILVIKLRYTLVDYNWRTWRNDVTVVGYLPNVNK